MKKSVLIIFCASIAIATASILWYESLFILSRKNYIIPSPTAVGAAQDAQPVSEFTNFKARKLELPSEPEEASLIFVGDVMLSRDVATKMRAKKDINYPFSAMGDYLRGADMVFGNLESPIVAGREIKTYEMVFHADPGAERALADANFRVMSLANNHILNFGAEGLASTYKFLDAEGIQYSGAADDPYAPVYREIKGMRFAFLSYAQNNFVNKNADVAVMDAKKMQGAVRRARGEADFVIVSMHAGEEYQAEPGRTQTDFARAAVDAGADMVIGHHPHVVQSAEIYKGKYIFYSLGNFVFDQMWSEETRRGIAVKAFFTKSGVSKIELMPVKIFDYAQPQPADEKTGAAIAARLKIQTANRMIVRGNDDAVSGRPAIYPDREAQEYNLLKIMVQDLDNDKNLEQYILENGTLTIKESEGIVWQSSEDWWVDDFTLADSTGDGAPDISMSVWKSGSFGDSHPFWEEGGAEVKNHFFVFDYADKKMTPVWQSSNLDAPNREFAINDIDEDGKPELVAIEGDYGGENRFIAVWRWNGWGFSNLWRSAAGNFANLGIEKLNGINYIVSDEY